MGAVVLRSKLLELEVGSLLDEELLLLERLEEVVELLEVCVLLLEEVGGLLLVVVVVELEEVVERPLVGQGMLTSMI